MQIYLPLLADIPPSPELSWFAPVAARNLFAGGRLRQAGAWVALLKQSPQTDPDIAKALPGLEALDDLAGQGGPEPAGQGPSIPLPPDDPRTARLRALFAAVAESAEAPSEPPHSSDLSSGDLQASIVATAPAPAMPQQNVNLWLDLGEASAKGRIGETVLVSLAGLNAAGLADAEPEWLARAVTALRRVGLEDEAHRLAVEAAIANGL